MAAEPLSKDHPRALKDRLERLGMDRNLRYGPTHRAQEMPTAYAFRRDGDMAQAIEERSRAGVCLQSGGRTCPSYPATREERHTTRGRANALRAAISGRLPPGALTSREMYEVMDLCLQCKERACIGSDPLRRAP
jgi:hypothetical protein